VLPDLSWWADFSKASALWPSAVISKSAGSSSASVASSHPCFEAGEGAPSRLRIYGVPKQN